MLDRLRKTNLATFAGHAFLIILLILVVYPFIYTLLSSFKSTREILVGKSIFPENFLISNYIEAWQKTNFKAYTWNSVWYTVLTVIGSLITSSMGGYVFARGEFRGKNLIFGIFTSLMFVVMGTASLYPKMEILKSLGLNSSLWGPLLMQFFGVNITNIYLVRGYINSLPKSLDESAEIDGCNFFDIYTRIILPVITPVMATVAVFSFGMAWNDYLLPMIVTLSSPEKRTLPVGMIALKGSADAAAAWNLIIAGAMMSAAPMIVVYLFFNKYFIRGVAAGAVKG